MSFPALALAAAAVTEVNRYTGIKPSFIRSVDIRGSHRDSVTGQPIYAVRAEVVAFGYLEAQSDGWPLGIHDPALPRDDRTVADIACEAAQ